MSGNSDRLINTMPTTIRVKGFNDTSSPAATLGLNSDSRPELYIPNMPSDLVLLCAADYTQSGATILFPNEGFVLALSPAEQQYLRSYAQDKPILKELTVKNNTYEVIDAPSSSSSPTPPLQQAYASTATRYFNSKINVSNVQERILATLLSGLTFKDLLTMTTNDSVLGMPRDITPQSLHNFENKYGRTPDILQLAFPDLGGNKKGYFAPKKLLTRCGERTEADYFEPEFNDLPYTDTPDPPPTNPLRKSKKTEKLPSFGGARAGYVYIDVYSGYVNGILVTSMKNSLLLVQSTVKALTNRNYIPSVFAADQGVISQSLYRVSIPAVQKFLRDHVPPITPECGEAYNHNNGTPHIEHVIRQIKELFRFAILNLLRNTNFSSFNFTRKQCLRL